MKAIVNASLVVGDSVLKGHTLFFDEKIRRIGKSTTDNIDGVTEIFDGLGKYLSAGFIDLHIHGCGGADTMDDDDGSLASISKNLLSTGVTSFLATTMTMEWPKIVKALAGVRDNMACSHGANLLGCYLEGPFISEQYQGAQDGRHILDPDFKLIEDFKDVIKVAVLAPEKKGAEEFIKNCNERGVIVAIGHTAAKYEEAMAAIEKGASLITHMFSAMTPLHHRKPGVVGAAMDSTVVCELVADNIHVGPAAQRILLKVKGIDSVVLITDSIRACMMEDGEYDLGGQKVIVRGKEARLASGVLAGSVLTLDRALKNFKANTGLGLADVLKTVTENPARVLKIASQKGSLEAGKDADMVIFDEEFNVYKTFVNGRLAYQSV